MDKAFYCKFILKNKQDFIGISLIIYQKIKISKQKIFIIHNESNGYKYWIVKSVSIDGQLLFRKIQSPSRQKEKARVRWISRGNNVEINNSEFALCRNRRKNCNDYAYSCFRDWRLLPSWVNNWGPPETPSDHHSTSISRGLREAINWGPQMGWKVIFSWTADVLFLVWEFFFVFLDFFSDRFDLILLWLFCDFSQMIFF